MCRSPHEPGAPNARTERQPGEPATAYRSAHLEWSPGPILKLRGTVGHVQHRHVRHRFLAIEHPNTKTGVAVQVLRPPPGSTGEIRVTYRRGRRAPNRHAHCPSRSGSGVTVQYLEKAVQRTVEVVDLVGRHAGEEALPLS